MAHHFPYDVKLRLLAHSRSFLANQKARNAIVGAENLLISDIPQFQLGNIRSRDAFRPIARKQKDLMDYNGSYTMMAKPMKTHEMHYPLIQFLIIAII